MPLCLVQLGSSLQLRKCRRVISDGDQRLTEDLIARHQESGIRPGLGKRQELSGMLEPRSWVTAMEFGPKKAEQHGEVGDRTRLSALQNQFARPVERLGHLRVREGLH